VSEPASERESKKPVVWTTLPDATAFQGVRRPPPPSGGQGRFCGAARRARLGSPPGGQVADCAAQVAGERWRRCAQGSLLRRRAEIDHGNFIRALKVNVFLDFMYWLAWGSRSLSLFLSFLRRQCTCVEKDALR
jgi:hypothetical protein